MGYVILAVITVITNQVPYILLWGTQESLCESSTGCVKLYDEQKSRNCEYDLSDPVY